MAHLVLSGKGDGCAASMRANPLVELVNYAGFQINLRGLNSTVQGHRNRSLSGDCRSASESCQLSIKLATLEDLASGWAEHNRQVDGMAGLAGAGEGEAPRQIDVERKRLWGRQAWFGIDPDRGTATAIERAGQRGLAIGKQSAAIDVGREAGCSAQIAVVDENLRSLRRQTRDANFSGSWHLWRSVLFCFQHQKIEQSLQIIEHSHLLRVRVLQRSPPFGLPIARLRCLVTILQPEAKQIGQIRRRISIHGPSSAGGAMLQIVVSLTLFSQNRIRKPARPHEFCKSRTSPRHPCRPSFH